MTGLVALVLAVVALAGTAVVLTTESQRQAMMLSAFGVSMGLLFMAMQAPDVALSEIGVGTAIVPLMVMLVVRKTERRE